MNYCDEVRKEEFLECSRIKDVGLLNFEVADIGFWEGLCMNLGVDRSLMNELKHSNKEDKIKKTECLQAYIDSGEAYWEKVVKAISNYPIDNKRIASQIAERYRVNKDLLELDYTMPLICNGKEV